MLINYGLLDQNLSDSFDKHYNYTVIPCYVDKLWITRSGSTYQSCRKTAPK